MNPRPNIILVHGAWADGSCWRTVIERLQAGGYTVTAPQFPSPRWLVAEDDQAIPPEAERQFAKRMGAMTVTIPAGHRAMASHPDDVAQLIKDRRRSCPGRRLIASGVRDAPGTGHGGEVRSVRI